MSTALALLENEFKPRLPSFENVLQPYRIPALAFQTGVLALFEQNPWLLDACKPQSVINACMSIAVQGLRLDPASEQSCIVPFNGKAQAITMVKGYTVIAARAGYTLQGYLVREGDIVREYGAPDPRIEHQMLGREGKIVGAYAMARSNTMPPLTSRLLSIDDLIKTRDGSKGYQSAMQKGKPHPWKTHFDAMAVKTPKRLLAKDIPNDMLQMAAWLETQHDLGRVAYLRPDGQGVIDTEGEEVYPARQPQPESAAVDLEPPFCWLLSNGTVQRSHSAHELEAKILFAMEGRAVSPEQATAALERNRENLAAWPDQAAAERVREAITRKIEQ